MTTLRKEIVEHRRAVEAKLKNGGEPTQREVAWMIYAMYGDLATLAEYHSECPALSFYRIMSNRAVQVGVTLLLAALVYAVIVAVQAGFKLP